MQLNNVEAALLELNSVEAASWRMDARFGNVSVLRLLLITLEAPSQVLGDHVLHSIGSW